MNKSLYQHLSLAPVPSGAEPLQLCLPQHLAVPRGEEGEEEEIKMEIDTQVNYQSINPQIDKSINQHISVQDLSFRLLFNFLNIHYWD